MEGGGGVPVEPEKKGSMEGGGKRRLLRSRTSVEGGDMLYEGQTRLFAMIVNNKLKQDLLDIMTLFLMNYSFVYRLLLGSIPSIVRNYRKTNNPRTNMGKEEQKREGYDLMLVIYLRVRLGEGLHSVPENRMVDCFTQTAVRVFTD